MRPASRRGKRFTARAGATNVRLDASDGRIDLPESILETYGDQFELVEREDRLADEHE